MLKKITSVKDFERIKPGDSMFDNPDRMLAKEYFVSRRAGEDLIVTYKNGLSEIKLLTKDDLLSHNWWVKE